MSILYYGEEGYAPQWELGNKFTLRLFDTGDGFILDFMKLTYDDVPYDKATQKQMRKLIYCVFRYEVRTIDREKK